MARRSSIGNVESEGWYRYIRCWDHCNNRRDTLAGQLIENFPSLAGVFVPSPSPAYLFSKPLNWLDFDPTYPKNPKTFGDYIRKFRKDKGLLIKDFAKQLQITEDTVINWEKRGRRPSKGYMQKVIGLVPQIARFFEPG